jgi:hypothetical protein
MKLLQAMNRKVLKNSVPNAQDASPSDDSCRFTFGIYFFSEASVDEDSKMPSEEKP